MEKKTKIFRFKLSEDVMEKITEFAKVHQYDDRHDYKNAWQEWCDENEEMVAREIKRLNSLDYNGDVIDKMFKAGRYYFRKKGIKSSKTNNMNIKSDEEPKKRRYITMNPKVIKLIDLDISNGLDSYGFKPSVGYSTFVNKYEEVVKNEVKRIMDNNEDITAEEIIIKFKKTYKNRYYISTKKREFNREE